MRRDPPPSAAAPGVYAHVPFCSVKCSYCDFPVAAGQDHRIERYIAALEREIATHAPDLDGDVDTVYLGGGTPSRLPVTALARVLGAVRARYRLRPDVEISMEANPEDIDPARAEEVRALGVDRITVGVQSLDDAVLRAAGRPHDGRRAVTAITQAVAAGFRSVGVDLIAGLPGERLARWCETVDRVVDAGAHHVSVYLLEVDHPSALGKAIRDGRAEPPDEDALAASYERAVERLSDAGLEMYEISNFARPGHRSRHNEKYWNDSWYAAFGNGAHGYVRGVRWGNLRGLTRYLRAVESGARPIGERDAWDPSRRIEEALFSGLRRTDGVDLETLERRYDVDLGRSYDEIWERHGNDGLVERIGSRIRLTPSGRLRADTVFRDLVGVLDRSVAGTAIAGKPR